MSTIMIKITKEVPRITLSETIKTSPALNEG